jgi:NADPH-dependent glutamate synthase beta subunit-like oxidoreductase
MLDQEAQRILAAGIEFKPHVALGRDVSLDELLADYRAVFLAPGRQQSREWNVDGRVPADLHTGMRLLQEWISVGDVPKIASAAIVGGGNTAVDLARVLRKAGAEAYVITHDALPGPDVPPREAMPAISREIEQAVEEGVIFHPHRGIRRLILRGEKVVGVELVHMKKLLRPDGQTERVAFEGTETVLHVDQVIPAIGQAVEAAGMERLLGNARSFNTDYWGRLADHSGLFAGGDARTGSRGTVSAAVGDGHRAALAIDRYLHGLGQP